MKQWRLECMMVIATLALAVEGARAEGVKIIANSSLQASEISAHDLKSIFLRERNSLSDGTHVEPVLERSGPVHETFVKQYLNQSGAQLSEHYQSLVFSGRASMPKQLRSDEEVVAYVVATRGAIGYVNSDANPAGVRTLAVVETLGRAERKLLKSITPDYPVILRTREIGGVVRLKVSIAANGQVQDVTVLGGNPILADSAKAAVEKWEYAAASSASTIEIKIPFDPHQ